jgi:hypothetical protein
VRILVLWLSLVIGNFLWQFFGDANWPIAIERSYFQAVALLLAAFQQRRRA